MNNKADVVIIGGGIIGAACVYYLTKAGFNTILVERGDLASGTSGGCDGNIMAQDHQPGYDTNLTLKSNELYKQLINELNWDIEYSQKGSLLVIKTEKELEFMLERMKEQKKHGLKVRFVEQDELYEQEPLLAPGLLGAIECETDAACMPIQACIGLARSARKMGAKILTHEKVLDIELDNNNCVTGVVTDKRQIKTARVVNCCGAWAPAIGEMVGIDIPIKPRRGQMVVVEKAAQVGHRKISEANYIFAKFHPELAKDADSDISKYGVAFVFEPTESGNMLIGSSREFAGYDTQTSYSVIKTIIDRAITFIPSLAKLHVIRTYAGLRPYTPDHFSIVSAVDEVPGFYIAAGAEGDGIGIGPLTGLLIKQLMLEEETAVDVKPLSWSRFK